MAKHERPPDYPNKQLRDFVCIPEHRENAMKLETFLSQFDNIRVGRTQYPDNDKQTVWYVGFDYDDEERYILNFDIQPNKFMSEFRRPKFMQSKPVGFIETGDWIKTTFDDFSEPFSSSLADVISKYLVNSKKAFDVDRKQFRKWVCKCKNKDSV